MESIGRSFATLSTPLVADACVRLGVPLRVAPAGIRSVVAAQRLAGRARPARHAGSVDVFFEAIADAAPGDVLVVDNAGRGDEGCVGDLVALEVQGHRLAGIVIWGSHRDSAELATMRVPVFSYGTCPAGPAHVRRRASDARTLARFGSHRVSGNDVVFADSDGVIFVAMTKVREVLSAARAIAKAERAHARRARAGVTLSEQFDFASYLRRARRNPRYTFREHLRRLGGAIEE